MHSMECTNIMKGNLGRVGKSLNARDIGTHGGRIEVGDLTAGLDKLLAAGVDFGAVSPSQKGHNLSESAHQGFPFNRIGRPNLTAGWGPVHTRFETIASSTGSNSNYHVTEIDFTVTTPGDYRIYLAHRLTLSSGGSIWSNDTSVGAIQILDNDNNVIHGIDTLYDSVNSTQGWQTLTYSSGALTSLSVLKNSLSNGFVDMVMKSTTTLSSRWNYAAGRTPSAYTGAFNGLTGISGTWDDIPMPVGYYTMPQTWVGSSLSSNESSSQSHGQGTYPNSSAFIYAEASSPRSYGNHVFCRTSSTYAIPASGKIRIAYLNAVRTGQTGMDEDDNLYIGFQ